MRSMGFRLDVLRKTSGLSSRRARKVLVAAAVPFVGALIFAGSAAATMPTISEFGSANGLAAGGEPWDIVAGPDHNLWFTDQGTTHAIGEINPTTHAISEFTGGLHAGSEPWDIAAGPDGNLWFTDQGTTSAIGAINPGTQAVAEFGTAQGLNAGSMPEDIAAGPDGNLWFTDHGTAPAIGRINPTTHAISEFGAANGLNAGSGPENIVAGPDGNLWFTDQGSTKAIGKINPTTHAISEFGTANGLKAGSTPKDIAAGPDGNLWFTDQGSTKAIGKINPTTHAISEFSAGLSSSNDPLGIAPGPDGNLWFADANRAIGRINPTTHAISEFGTANGLNAGSEPLYIAAGPGRNLWFTDQGTTPALGRITTPAPPPPAAPKLTNVSQSHRRWREGKALPHIASAKRPPVGTTFRFTVDERVRVRFTFTQKLPGRKVKGRCVAAKTKNRNKSRCTRTLVRGVLSFAVGPGRHSVRFQGRLSKHKKLKPGRYTVIITATNAAHQRATARLTFTIVAG